MNKVYAITSHLLVAVSNIMKRHTF